MNDIEILQSNKYNKFTTFDWNRSINESLLRKLKTSMQAHGYIPSLPIIVSPKLEIYDGQHRFYAAQELKMFFSYIIDEDFDVQQVWQTNKSRASWRISDYVHYFSVQNNLNYKKLQAMSYETGLTYKTLVTIMQGGPKGYAATLRSGHFQFSEDESFLNKLEQFKELNTYCKNFTSEKLTTAIIQLIYLPGYDHKNMLTKLEYQSTRIVKCVSQEEYLELFKDIYNYKNTLGRI